MLKIFTKKFLNCVKRAFYSIIYPSDFNIKMMHDFSLPKSLITIDAPGRCSLFILTQGGTQRPESL